MLTAGQGSPSLTAKPFMGKTAQCAWLQVWETSRSQPCASEVTGRKLPERRGLAQLQKGQWTAACGAAARGPSRPKGSYRSHPSLPILP